MSLPDYDPIFGEAAVVWDEAAAAGGYYGGAGIPLPRFFFCAKVTGVSRIEVVASDFHSHVWSRVFGSTLLEDMKDEVGFGGSCPDLVDYLASSLSCGIVKLVLSGLPNLTSGVVHAKLIAQKFEGMPRIPLSLSRVTGSSANDAMSNFSIALFKTYKSKHNDVVKEQECSLRIKKFLSSEQSEVLQRKLASLQEKCEDLQRKLAIHSYEHTGRRGNEEMPPPSTIFKDIFTLEDSYTERMADKTNR